MLHHDRSTLEKRTFFENDSYIGKLCASSREGKTRAKTKTENYYDSGRNCIDCFIRRVVGINLAYIILGSLIVSDIVYLLPNAGIEVRGRFGQVFVSLQ